MSAFVDEFVEDFSDDSEAEGDNPRRRNADFVYKVGLRLQDEIHDDMGEISDEDMLRARFNTDEDAYFFYNEYAKFKGFSVRKDHKTVIDGTTRRRRFICSCAGVRAVYDDELNMWTVRGFMSQHNHVLAPPGGSHFLRSHRKVSLSNAVLTQNLYALGVSKKLVMDIIISKSGSHAAAGCTARDLYNQMNRARVERIIDGDANLVNSFLEDMNVRDPGFFKKIQVNEKKQLTKLFWSDSQSQEDYKLFGDVLMFDSTYRTNRYDMALVVFAGVNNHRHTVIYALALMNNETIDSYEWALKTFLAAMDGIAPKSVITDGDAVIRNAIENVFPKSKHRLCVWHVVQNAITNVWTDGFVKGFVEAMFCKGPPDAFEKKWAELLIEYKTVAEQKWVHNIYEKKEMWAEAYLREYFFAGCRSNQRCESINSVVRLCVKSGLSLIELVDKLLQKIRHIRYRDFEAEVNTTMTRSAQIPNLTLIGEQAEALYTRAAVVCCNESYEDGEDIIKYLVNRHMHPNAPATVEYNREKDAYNCTCKLFERVGFLCRHILAVLKHTHVKALPKSCILHRWTREAKSSSLDFGTNPTTSCRLGFGLRLKELEEYSRDLFMWGCESVQRCVTTLLCLEFLKAKKASLKSGRRRGGPRKAKRKMFHQRTSTRCGICHIVGHSRRTCPSLLSDDEVTDHEHGSEGGIIYLFDRGYQHFCFVSLIF
ncbi:hypothetical protein AQUCO_00300825v1 [Aquilegia coerulea]|uniref:SWIM-type domain-containing protein n=1 Tax=Aquilegia coerulea TaxID=218851 RepID=A0A2G5F0N6_AQUCA|nr:hypothetical protein AQUCO_00300825v1 [Aquilegia coerulea]